jgi:putative ABC transport system permease protein
VIGLLEIRRRKVQFSLIALIVILISYLVLMINGLGVGLNRLAGSALLNFDADAIVYADGAGLSVIRSELSSDVVDRAASLQGVEASAPLGYLAANYRFGDGEVASAAFLGFDPGTIGEPSVVSGRALNPDDRFGMLADRSFIRTTGFTVGDIVPVSLRLETVEFEIVGEIDEGAFFFQPAIYILRDTWQDLKYGPGADGSPAASIVLLQGDGLIGQYEGFEAVTKSVAFNNIEGVQGQQATVTALRWFGYLIGALIIGAFFYVLTLQRVAQIGVMKAIGASGFFVFRQGFMQVVAISAAGLAISIPLAWASDRALQELPDAVPIAFTTGTYVTTSVSLLLAASVGAMFSARQVGKVDPIIALGQQQ